MFTNTRGVWRDGKEDQESFQDLRYREGPLDFGAEIASGDLIESRLDVMAPAHLEYVMFEDPKPAGCEPLELIGARIHLRHLCVPHHSLHGIILHVSVPA